MVLFVIDDLIVTSYLIVDLIEISYLGILVFHYLITSFFLYPIGLI